MLFAATTATTLMTATGCPSSSSRYERDGSGAMYEDGSDIAGDSSWRYDETIPPAPRITIDPPPPEVAPDMKEEELAPPSHDADAPRDDAKSPLPPDTPPELAPER